MPRKFTLTVMSAAALWMLTLAVLTAHDAREAKATPLGQPAPVEVSTL